MLSRDLLYPYRSRSQSNRFEVISSNEHDQKVMFLSFMGAVHLYILTARIITPNAERDMHKHKYYAVGLMLIIGVATVIASLNYNLGTLARMGPGYFPLLLGIVLVALGGLLAVTSDTDEEIRANAAREPFKPFARRRLRTWTAIAGGIAAFVVLGRYGGLVPATFVLILASALGDPKNSLKASFWLATGVTAFAVLVFHYGLQMQFALFSWA